MGSRRFWSLSAFVFALVSMLLTAGCGCSGIGGDDDDSADDNAGGDDDGGSDDDGSGDDDSPPHYPKNHETGWDCYICHGEGLYDAPQEPHGGEKDAPDDCIGCHDPSDNTYTDPDAPEGHGEAENCLDCHQGEHDRTFGDPLQCLVCHLPGDGPPKAPAGHDLDWNCDICHHDEPFYGAEAEPHGGAFHPPDDCTACHAVGDWTYTNDNAPEGHGAAQGCLTCHAGEHGADWTDQAQCAVCHLPGEAASQFSKDHKTTWDCYICHASNFNGAPREPHSHAYTAPDQCLACHEMGTFSSSRHGPEPEDDHTPAWDCLNCHSTRHGKPWQDNDQCKLCHRF